MTDPLSVERLTQVRELFEKASILPASERSVFLDSTCGEDLDLHSRVSALLAEAESVDSPIEGLVNDVIWPALESLSCDPSGLQGWLDDRFGTDSEEEDPLVGKSVAHFEILAPIGRGGMGMVYHARDHTLDRTVALKFLPPSLSSDRTAKDRFIHEAKAASGLDHANIATVHEIGETEDHQLFIAMGYYPGETLKEKVAESPIPPATAIEYAIQLVRGMKEAHGHGVIHRDIKPGNIMITADGTVVLLDFGLAKLSHETGYTQVGQVAGTIAYMSPEQARSEAIDQRTDLWSFGVVLYEMLTGKRPFGGDNAQSVIRAILEEDPEPPVLAEGEVPEPLKRIIGLCLAKNPKHRYQSAEDLLEDLQRAREGMVPAKRGGRATWNRRSRRRRWIMFGVGAVILSVGYFSIQPFLTSEQVTFTRITEGAIVEDQGKFACLAWGDYDGDGFVDVAVANNQEGGCIHLYHNIGDGTFSRVTEGVLVTDPIAPLNLNWADQDNDGDLDLFATTFDHAPNAFYRNEGAGIFTKATEGVWVNTPGSGLSSAWGDYDNDGSVDLYVSNYGTPDPERNFLYQNKGDGTMEAVTTEANATAAAASGACLWTDYDHDGDLDLFVAGQDQTQHQQFRNDGDGTFTPVSFEDGGIPPINEGLGAAFSSANYDNDRDLDLLLTIYDSDPGFRLDYNEFKVRFLEADHVLPSAGSMRAPASAWGDYDNDGFQDLFITNHIGRNLLYHNEGNGSFRRITESPLVSEELPSAGAAWTDYDNDGDLDLMVSNGMWAEFEETCEFYRNDGGTNHWIVLKLTGTLSNRSAIGAKVWARATIEGRSMTQLREIGGGGHGNNQPDLRVHFGLGNATSIDTLRIEWPSGQVQEMRNVAANQFLTVTENTVVDSESLIEQASSSVTFTRITEGAIVEDKGNFACLAWGDYDDDGYVDVAVANNQEGGFNHLYHNTGDGTFTRVTEGILVTDPVLPHTLAWADQDNDGDLDLFVGSYPKSLDVFYRNDGNGIFTKVIDGDWVNTPDSAASVAWGDYDNDGFVDLYVSNLGIPHSESNFLYHNKGDGMMEAVTTEANVMSDRSAGCLWSDYDNDGDVDLFVAQERAQFRNNGDGTFAWIPPEDGGIPAITADLLAAFSSANYDNDGDLDLLYTTWGPDLSNRLYRNEFGGRSFLDVSVKLSSAGSIRGLSSAWGDYDNDGFQDLFIANQIGKNLLFHNEGNARFRQITESPIVSESHRSGGSAWADYDNDGDLDLFVSNGYLSDLEESCELFRNDGGTNNWINLKLVGTTSNRSAIGAKVLARAAIDGQHMTQLREIHGGGDGNNQSDLRVHFGLGDATSIDSLRIEWPSGHVQEMSDVSANQFLTIIEDVEVGPRPVR